MPRSVRSQSTEDCQATGNPCCRTDSLHGASVESTRLGRFELSAYTGELRKDSIRLKLSGQAIQVLTMCATIGLPTANLRQTYASTLHFPQNFRTRSASRESLSPTWQARKAVLFSIRMWMMPTLDCDMARNEMRSSRSVARLNRPSDKTLTSP